MSTFTPARGASARSTPRARPYATLISVCFGLFMVGLDGTVVSIANPAIAASLGATFTELQWVTNSYLLGLAALLILGGRLGDRYGRRRLYLIGLVAFAVTSVAIGLVGTAAGVIAFRALQGASAAILMPQTLALLRATFPREKFGMAAGLWGGVSSVAIAAGPIVGGIVVGSLGWEWVFYLNAPVAVIGLVVSLRFLVESTSDDSAPVDVHSAVLLALGLVGVVLAVVQSAPWGWDDPRTLTVLVAGLGVLGAFLVRQGRIQSPLLPPAVLRAPGVWVGGLAIATNFFVLLGVTFFLPLFFMNTLGGTGLEAGLMMLPLSGVSIVSSPIGAALVSRFGVRMVATLGLVLLGGACLAMLGVDATSPYVAVAVPMVFLSLGVGMVMTSAADAIVGGVPVHQAGVAGGFQTTMLQVGGALGTAVLSAVISGGVASGSARLGLDPGETEALAQGLAPARLTGAASDAARDTFVTGMHGALLVAGVVALVVAVGTAALLRNRTHHSVAEVRHTSSGGAPALRSASAATPRCIPPNTTPWNGFTAHQ